MAAPPSTRQLQVLSSQRKTAPCARTARRKDDVLRSVSWLAGHNPPPPSRAFLLKAQWHFWRRTHRLQLRAQLRIWLAVDKQRTAPNSHLPINVIDKPEPTDLKRSQSFCQRNRRPHHAIPEFRGQSVCFMQHRQIPSR